MQGLLPAEHDAKRGSRGWSGAGERTMFNKDVSAAVAGRGDLDRKGLVAA